MRLQYKRSSRNFVSHSSLWIPILGLTSACMLLIGCESVQQQVQNKEDALAAAGFTVKPANTPEREQMLHRLPPNRFVQRPKNGVVDYVYADPLVCNCLYVGDQNAYNRLKEHEREQHLADEAQMTADTYSDAEWNWGAWGPWGGGWRFGPDVGW
jgi:hypothetical protein